MPIQPTYPGVYIEEVPSGVRTITGVATSVAAFVDFFRQGTVNKAVQVFNFGDFEREFGGLDKRSEASYAVQQFFLNGGTEAWIVRVVAGTGANTPAAARAFIGSVPADPLPANEAAANGVAALIVAAASEGTWGSGLRVRVDRIAGTDDFFNLTVQDENSGRQEAFRNLSIKAADPRFSQRLVNDPNTGSKLIRLTAKDNALPLANGTLSGDHNALPVLPSPAKITVTLQGDGPAVTSPEVTLGNPGPLALPVESALARIAPVVESAIRSMKPDHPAFAGATVEAVGKRLRVLPGGTNAAARFEFVNNPTTTALRLSTAATVNVQRYALGDVKYVKTAQIFGAAGVDGTVPDANALIGNLVGKTGIHALEEVDLFNLLCLPRTAQVGSDPGDLTEAQAQAVLAVANAYCEKRRAFLLMDTPKGIDEPQEIKNWLAARSTLRHKNAALFYPRVRIPDPLDEFRLRSTGASGTLAGLFARTDVARGVWKAPAGTEATLRNVTELDDLLSDPENGTLNPLAINCLRSFPVYGNVSWGARTLDGADQQASEWKYIPVRRLALFLEESLYRGTQWVVFEPNDEPLWSQIRTNVGAFMHNLFRQGAFQGRSPREAYLVKCDRETTTQNDINNGIVNVVVGFAPLKPAEFVILKIQQLAGQIQT